MGPPVQNLKRMHIMAAGYISLSFIVVSVDWTLIFTFRPSFKLQAAIKKVIIKFVQLWIKKV